jgi:hypothetical protein
MHVLKDKNNNYKNYTVHTTNRVDIIYEVFLIFLIQLQLTSKLKIIIIKLIKNKIYNEK